MYMNNRYFCMSIVYPGESTDDNNSIKDQWINQVKESTDLIDPLVDIVYKHDNQSLTGQTVYWAHGYNSSDRRFSLGVFTEFKNAVLALLSEIAAYHNHHRYHKGRWIFNPWILQADTQSLKTYFERYDLVIDPIQLNHFSFQQVDVRRASYNMTATLQFTNEYDEPIEIDGDVVKVILEWQTQLNETRMAHGEQSIDFSSMK